MLSSFARAVLISLLAAVSLHGQTMTVAQRLPLHKATHGMEGWLEVLTDARLSQNLKREMWGVGDWPFVLPQNDLRRKVFAKQPPLNATLRVLDRQSHVVDTRNLEMPLARIAEEQIQGQHPTFMVTVDYSVGFGSYAGLSTFLLDITMENWHGQVLWTSPAKRRCQSCWQRRSSPIGRSFRLARTKIFCGCIASRVMAQTSLLSGMFGIASMGSDGCDTNALRQAFGKLIAHFRQRMHFHCPMGRALSNDSHQSGKLN